MAYIYLSSDGDGVQAETTVDGALLPSSDGAGVERGVYY